MPVKKVLVGDGITARERVRVTAPHGKAETEAIKKGITQASKAGSFDGMVSGVEAWALSVLLDAGMPTDGSAHTGQGDTPERYANEIVNRLGFVRAVIERGEAERAARFSLQLGVLIEQARLKFEWEKPALMGQEVERGASKGGKKRADRYSHDYAALLAAKQKAHPLWSLTQCRRAVAADLGVSIKTVERNTT
jgi:hypothetical protein